MHAITIKFTSIPGLDLIISDTIWAISKDKQGYLWLGSDSGLYFYDGYKIKSINDFNPEIKIKNVRIIFEDRSGKLWIGTKGNGLFQIINKKIIPFQPSNNTSIPQLITSIIEDQNGLWVGSKGQLIFISKDNVIKKIPLPNSANFDQFIKVTGIIEISHHQLLVTTQYSVHVLDKINQTFLPVPIEGLKDNYINTVYKDSGDNIWLGTDFGVLLKKANHQNFNKYMKKEIPYRINAIAVDENQIWFGSTKHGLITVHKSNSTIETYKNDPLDNTTISGNSIVAIKLINKSAMLLMSSFNGGFSLQNTRSLKFGLEKKDYNSIHCADSDVIYGIDEENKKLWISTNMGLIEFNANNNECTKHNIDTENKIISPMTASYTFKDSADNRWIADGFEIHKIDKSSSLIRRNILPNLNAVVYHMIEARPNTILLASNKGLYRYSDEKLNKIELLKSHNTNSDAYHIAQGFSNDFLVATRGGLAVLNEMGEYKIHSKIQEQLPTKFIFSMHLNDKYLWVGTKNEGLFKFNRKGDLVTQYGKKNGFPSLLTIYSIINDKDDLWIGTNKGLIRLNTKNDQAHVFHTSDGLQGEFFTLGSVTKSSDGMLYFGGRKGLNAFYPDHIKLNQTPPKVVLTQLTRFGKIVHANDEQSDFLIKKPINELDELELTHKDYVVGFEFAALDYADPSRNQYAYKMEGLNPDWTYVNADDRKISYSNLAAGDYTFRVKASNKDGIWNEHGKSLSIKVLPAPWLTWWAYVLYMLTFMILMFAYQYRKNRANALITQRLRIEVKKQTKELQVQKTKVESLLERKNELFANISHEFRTPLTLILGPINQLLRTNQHHDNIKSLEMVNRNANRLLTMIEQLLQLAKMNSHENISFVPQQIQDSLKLLVASFQPLAETKNISLTLVQNQDVAISATQDVIEIVFGNLISNAIKYTQEGGTITVNSLKHDNFVTIEVTDNGCGLDEKQQVEIFNRFTRLDSHLNIAGVGIGLSVVDEILKINNGSIHVNSESGKGSTFSVRFHYIELNQATQRLESHVTLIDQLTKESDSEQDHTPHVQYYGSKSNETILIIDDNTDMRTLVANTLKDNYYCITAHRGKTGIAAAIKAVPDIIICDVMMPEMDGFQVSRLLRSDTRTSHIPLILLTALNDKKNRIKGWRENIDMYLTKPFDAQELLIQLENVLVIRTILKKKASAAIQSGKISMNSGLPRKDQIFVDKFIKLVDKMYIDANFSRTQMANIMAVSDRQLQRKLKALIDINPADFLRDYRLKQATKSLKDGYQVSITSDNCGFNSVSYFSKCFKNQYGVSPKVYQQTCNLKS